MKTRNVLRIFFETLDTFLFLLCHVRIPGLGLTRLCQSLGTNHQVKASLWALGAIKQFQHNSPLLGRVQHTDFSTRKSKYLNFHSEFLTCTVRQVGIGIFLPLHPTGAAPCLRKVKMQFHLFRPFFAIIVLSFCYLVYSRMLGI